MVWYVEKLGQTVPTLVGYPVGAGEIHFPDLRQASILGVKLMNSCFILIFSIGTTRSLAETGMRPKVIMVSMRRDKDTGIQKIHDYFSLRLSANAFSVET